MFFSQNISDQKLQLWLSPGKTVAIIGLSPKPHRPSNQVATYLLAHGFTVIPVNPGQDAILDQPCYADLLSVPVHIDIACIFRRADQVTPIVHQAISKKVSLIWMQEGIVNHEAAGLAATHNIAVIMDRCMKKEHQRLFPLQHH